MLIVELFRLCVNDSDASLIAELQGSMHSTNSFLSFQIQHAVINPDQARKTQPGVKTGQQRNGQAAQV